MPLLISDNGLFKGNIRIDAQVRGDLNKKIPKLVIYKIRSFSQIDPGKSIIISLELLRGELSRLLRSFPQASLEIKFTLYLDPIATEQDEVTNRLADIKPIMVTARRPGIEFTSQYLQNRFNSISLSQQPDQPKD